MKWKEGYLPRRGSVYGIVIFACTVFPNRAVKPSVLGHAELSRGCKNPLVNSWKSTERMTHFKPVFVALRLLALPFNASSDEVLRAAITSVTSSSADICGVCRKLKPWVQEGV